MALTSAEFFVAEVRPIFDTEKNDQLESDPASPEELFERYAKRLCHLAEQNLSRKLAGRVDGEDVVQSVFRTFFRRSACGEFRIDSSADLWRLLVKITVLKARAKARHHTAAVRDVTAELAGGNDWLRETAAREPGPAEAADLSDRIEGLLKGLPLLYCNLLEMRLEGYAVIQIAEHLRVSRRTVHRGLNLLQQRLLSMASEDAD